ncbi:MAG: tRNA epoxyqueuosine(34) reductase QueG [Woeseia sp.]
MNEIYRNRDADLHKLAAHIKEWGEELGFQQIGISDIDLEQADQRLTQWLRRKFHGEMHHMHLHGRKRSRPAELVPGTVRVISARMDYLPREDTSPDSLLDHPSRAYVSRYALGRDYHKVLRGRLKALAGKIEAVVGEYGHRVFIDSAPVLEKPLAEKAGLGWIGKHTNLINRNAGSWFFLGEVYTDLPLPVDKAEESHCGTCRACLDVCPTGAIVAPYVLDARRCISYLTIELKGSIPVEYRKLIGNRIFGCDDCQIYCPWNKFATATDESDFAPRNGLGTSELTDLFNWNEQTWLEKTEGSAIRRIGYRRWRRNIAVALGNADSTPEVIDALDGNINTGDELVDEHVSWARQQHGDACRV